MFLTMMKRTSKSPWLYNGNIVDDESQFPEGTLGFVYRIVRVSDGKFYYGKKLGWFSKTSIKTVTLKSGVKKRKKVKSLVPSDWKTYWSSSPELVADVGKLGEAAFTREILMFCSNKGSLGYFEARSQMDARVLERNDSYNGIINCRVHRTHVKPIL